MHERRDRVVHLDTYTPAVFKVEGLAENLYAEAPAATLTITSLEGAQQARFFTDSFRGDTVTVRILMWSAGAWTDTTYSLTLTCDADQTTENEVPIRLASSDAVEGTDVPRRTTQEAGCQHDFMTGGCSFRPNALLPTTIRENCLKGLKDCRDHYPPLCLEHGVLWVACTLQNTHTKIVQPLPYGACYGGLTHRLVLG